MSVLFQEQAAELQSEVLKLRKASENLERDRDRLAGLLRDEKAAHGRTGKRADAAEEDNKQLQIQVERGKALAGTLAGHEQARHKAEKALAESTALLESTVAELATTAHAHAQARADYLGTKAERDRLRDEIGPFRTLIGALKNRGEVDALIDTELGKLDS